MPVADSNNRKIVILGGKEYIVKVIPMARIRKLGAAVASILTDTDAIDMNNPQTATQTVFDKLLEMPHELLSLFIDELPRDIFEDQDNGVTFPEFYDALMVALSINRVDVLKNVFSRLIPALNQARQSVKTNS